MASYINPYIQNYSSYIPQLPQFLTSGKPTPSAELETAIYAADISAIKTLINSSPDLLSAPFANGDLPLNVAVREKKFECVKELLLLGADPKQRDNQQLSAVDYAIMTKDDKLVADILHHFVSADLSSVKNLLQNDQNLKQVKATQLEIKTLMSKTELTTLPLIHQAIFQKNKDWLKNLLATTENLANIRTIDGNSILHFAAASGDAEIMNLCLAHPGSKDAINALNNKGQTPLHYAAALDHLDLMQVLVEKGANIKSEDTNKITPLALLSAHSNEKNPLNISRREMFIFLTTAAYWTTQFLPIHTLSLESYLLLQGALVTGAAVSQALIYGSNFKTWKGLFGNIALGALMQSNSTLKLAFTAFNTAFFAKNMFEGLNSCWRNASLGAEKAVAKAVVGYAPKAKFIYDFVQANVFPQEINVNELTPLEDFAVKKLQLCQSSAHPDICMQKAWKGVQVCTDEPQSEACMDAGDEFGNFLEREAFFATSFNHYKLNGFRDYAVKCRIDFESAACLKAEETLKAEAGFSNQTDDKTILSCFDAKVIIGCADEGLQACKRAFKRAVLPVHPDKTNNDPEKTKIYTKLSDAMKTIEDQCSF